MKRTIWRLIKCETCRTPGMLRRVVKPAEHVECPQCGSVFVSWIDHGTTRLACVAKPKSTQ
jgi:LSD1 subclass zinc finger protein